MAYMTYYHMEISDPEPSMKDLERQLAWVADKTLPGNPHYENRLAFWEGVLSGDLDASWYDHREIMQQISLEWPGVLFTLNGRGDDQDDQWVEYHIDGKVHRAERPGWEPPPFDQDQLV